MSKRTMVVVKNVLTLEHSDETSEEELLEIAANEAGYEQPAGMETKSSDGSVLRIEGEMNEAGVTRSERID